MPVRHHLPTLWQQLHAEPSFQSYLSSSQQKALQKGGRALHESPSATLKNHEFVRLLSELSLFGQTDKYLLQDVGARRPLQGNLFVKPDFVLFIMLPSSRVLLWRCSWRTPQAGKLCSGAAHMGSAARSTPWPLVFGGGWVPPHETTTSQAQSRGISRNTEHRRGSHPWPALPKPSRCMVDGARAQAWDQLLSGCPHQGCFLVIRTSPDAQLQRRKFAPVASFPTFLPSPCRLGRSQLRKEAPRSSLPLPLSC